LRGPGSIKRAERGVHRATSPQTNLLQLFSSLLAGRVAREVHDFELLDAPAAAGYALDTFSVSGSDDMGDKRHTVMFLPRIVTHEFGQIYA
jgi:hypothetical protein